MLLCLEEVEQVAASGEAETEAGNPADRAQRSARHRINRRRIVVPGSLEQIPLVDETRSEIRIVHDDAIIGLGA
jgi:hypothetical protein